MSPLPAPSDLAAAVQNPARCFRDATLRQCRHLPGPPGLPECYAGGFAVAFPMRHANGGKLAVRGLVTKVPDLLQRYAAYEAFRAKAPASLRSHLLRTSVLPEGVLAGGAWHPLIVMDWVEGTTLNDWTQASLRDPGRLAAGACALEALFQAMAACGFVHGDLQHGNVLMDGLKPVLVDYDTVVVPGAPTLPRVADGHPNFRHPAFPANAAPDRLDRFPMLVILTALKALVAAPDLAIGTRRLEEGLLFLEADLKDPATSPLFQDLLRRPATARMAGALAAAAQGPWSAVPDLACFLREAGPAPKPGRSKPVRTPMPPPLPPPTAPQTARPIVPLLSLALLAGGGAGFASALLARSEPKPVPVAVASPPPPPEPVVQAVIDPEPSEDMAPAELVPAGITVLGAAPEAQAEPAPEAVLVPVPAPAPPPPPPEPPRLLWDLPTPALRAQLEPLAREAEAEWARRAGDLQAQLLRADATLANLSAAPPDSRFPLRHADGREVLVSQDQLLAAYRQRRAQLRADLENGERPVRQLATLALNPGEDPNARQVALRSLTGLPPGADLRLRHLLAQRHPLP